MEIVTLNNYIYVLRKPVAIQAALSDIRFCMKTITDLEHFVDDHDSKALDLPSPDNKGCIKTHTNHKSSEGDTMVD